MNNIFHIVKILARGLLAMLLRRANSQILSRRVVRKLALSTLGNRSEHVKNCYGVIVEKTLKMLVKKLEISALSHLSYL